LAFAATGRKTGANVMDWRDWELFCAVVEHGGFSAAARALGHPKSSLSAAVQRLESHLGLRLIERTTRHLRMTDAGDTIYRRVRPLFSALHDTHSEALAMSGAVAGTLRIKAPYEFGAHHAGPVACGLMELYPGLTIRIDVEHEIVNPVAENYDLVFAMLEAPLPSAGIVIRRVFTLERGLFGAPALLERFGEPHTLEDVAQLPLLAGPNDKAWAITLPGGKTEHLGVEKAKLVSSNAHIRLQAALAGHGILRVTRTFAHAAVEADLLRRLLPGHICEPLSVHALMPARQFVPAKVRCFLDALEAHAHAGSGVETEPLPG
jgi:DNA-binding transcriptional LysR family regulator